MTPFPHRFLVQPELHNSGSDGEARLLHVDRVEESQLELVALEKVVTVKGPGARANLGHLSVWFGEHQIVVRGSNSDYMLTIFSRSYVLS